MSMLLSKKGRWVQSTINASAAILLTSPERLGTAPQWQNEKENSYPASEPQLLISVLGNPLKHFDISDS
jgi:hypothetical protein